MPARKGRKRNSRERRRRDDTAVLATETAAPTSAAKTRTSRRPVDNGPLPSTTARVTGLMVALLTAFLAAVMVNQSVSGEASGIDRVARIAGGIALIVLAVVVGVLSVFPGQVRDWFARRR